MWGYRFGSKGKKLRGTQPRVQQDSEYGSVPLACEVVRTLLTGSKQLSYIILRISLYSPCVRERWHIYPIKRVRFVGLSGSPLEEGT
jgi:hypothetical protein